MASGYKNPPKFDEDGYESWKNELDMWQLVTDLEKRKQALAVTLSLTGKAKEAALGINAGDLNKEEGMKTLIDTLDKVFLKEQVDCAYESYTNFDKYKKEVSMSMSDYIIEFDQRYQKTRKYDMALPDAVLAFKLLDNASLTPQERKLALTACSELKYNNMKSALKRIFADGATATDGDSNQVVIKQESAFITENRRYRPTTYQRGGFNQGQRGSFNPGFRKKGMNPTDRFGRTSRCIICQSIYHWQKDCPHKTESVNMNKELEIDECNLTLYAQENISENEVFVTESQNAAVIDTACTRTVCGEGWLEDYMCNVSDDTVVSQVYSHKPFKFGDGRIVYSSKRVRLPAKIGNNKCNIDAEVVNADIPLLLSKSSLKKADAVLDLKNDTVTMFNQPIDLQYTASGHYCIDILGKANCTDNLSDSMEEHVLVVDNMDKTVKIKELTKLHKQFGHASANRLKELLKNAGVEDKDLMALLQKVTDSCDTCQKFKRAIPKPVVGFPHAWDYNESVAVDLHQLGISLWYLHIIDEFTRFSAGCITHTKQSSQFVKNFIKHWISIHGAPKRLFSDNGGEFDNDEVRDMAENFNIQVVTTPAYSPWSNGLCERHNQILTEILLKVKKDHKLDWETALSWALMSKNLLQNVHGYSPYQLVFGRNPNLPSTLTDLPPALEGTTRSQVVADHMTALHAARQQFMKAECSERIRRALLRQTRPSLDPCAPGDKVFYKRPDSQEWRGPGKVIGYDGPVVFVRHGGSLVRVHRCRLRKFEEPLVPESTCDLAPGADGSANKPASEKCELDAHDEEDDHDQENATNQDQIHNGQEDTNRTCVQPFNGKLKPGQHIRYNHMETNQVICAEVLSRAGKSTGANKTWYNLKILDPPEMKDNELSVDMSRVKDLELIEPRTVPEDDDSVLIVEDTDLKQAKITELESWKNNNVFIEVPYEGQKLISTRWVCSMKSTPAGIIPKARLVARGFEEHSDSIQKDSPTCGHDSLRVILSILANCAWKLHSMDIKTAFLQGQTMDRDVYVKPPKEANAKGVWHLKKCVYGLSDASLQWYRQVKSAMLETGGIGSKVDPAVFYWLNQSGNVIGILGCHVDDFIWGGTEKFENNVINKIRATFKIGKEDSVAFQYCGIQLKCYDGCIILNQDKYTDNLTTINVQAARAVEKDDELTEDEKHSLRSKVGQLLWLAHQSRPDLLFDVIRVATKLKHCTVQDMLTINKVINKAKASKMSLTFQQLEINNDPTLVVYSDASLGNLPDGGSQGGYLILLVGKSGKFSPIWWNSKKLRRVVRSSLAAETLSMSEAIDMSVFIATLYAELTKGKPDPKSLDILCVTDCKSLLDALKSSKFVLEKRLRIELSAIKEMIENGQLKDIQWCDTTKQLADCLTKCGASSLTLRKTLQEGKL